MPIMSELCQTQKKNPNNAIINSKFVVIQFKNNICAFKLPSAAYEKQENFDN